MERLSNSILSVALAAALFIPLMSAPPADAGAPGQEPAPTLSETVVADGYGTQSRELEPRYEPVAPQPESDYNDSYIFALTRGVADSTFHPAAKVPFFLFTVPLDIVFLPFAAIGGIFG